MKKGCIIMLLSVLLLITGCSIASDSYSDMFSETNGKKSGEYPEFTGLTLSENVIEEYSTLNNKSRMPQLFCRSGENSVFKPCGRTSPLFPRREGNETAYGYRGVFIELLRQQHILFIARLYAGA